MSTEAPPAYNDNLHPPELKQEAVELAKGLKAQTYSKQGSGQVLVQLTAHKLPMPTPVDVLVIVDISGSMDTELLVQNQEDQANSKDKVSLSRLDLVRHCLLTMLKTKAIRNFGMITFSDAANVIVDMKSVQTNLKQMTDAVTALRTEGGTNLRDALIAASQFLTKLPKDSNPPVVYLLTDGLPTDGFDLNAYCEAFTRLSTRHFAKPVALHSFGFGYVNEANNGVDCGLLDKLSKHTGGTMGFISDPSMMEVLLHSHAILAQARAFTGVGVRIGNEQFNIGTMASGQTHSILINKADSLGPVVVQLSSHQSGKCAPVEFRPVVIDDIEGEMLWAENSWRDSAASLLRQIAANDFAASSIAKLMTNIKENNAGPSDFASAASSIAKLITDIKENTAGFQGRSEFIQNLVATLQGEVSAAVANKAAYIKWGRNYYRALSRALTEQQRINRHDACLKSFNNDELVTEMIEANYDTFLATAAPPSSRVKYNPVTNKVVPVAPSAPAFKPAAIFNRRNAGGCFTGNGRVQLADGSFKTVEQVEVGDQLATSNGASANVLFILRTKINAPISLCRVDNSGLYVTPYHPIRMNDSWVFPTHVLESETVNVPFVYDFVLDQHHTIRVNDQELVTLGHGLMQDPVTAHAFFGTRRVVEDIEKLAVKGVLEIEPSQFVRNEHGLIAGIQ